MTVTVSQCLILFLTLHEKTGLGLRVCDFDVLSSEIQYLLSFDYKTNCWNIEYVNMIYKQEYMCLSINQFHFPVFFVFVFIFQFKLSRIYWETSA